MELELEFGRAALELLPGDTQAGGHAGLSCSGCTCTNSGCGTGCTWLLPLPETWWPDARNQC